MYAVVSDRQQQYRVAPGDRVRIALIDGAEPGNTVIFHEVCVVGGEAPQIGAPFVEGAKVTAKVLGTVKGKKLIVSKFRRRKASKRRTGFRARFTEVQIEAVQV